MCPVAYTPCSSQEQVRRYISSPALKHSKTVLYSTGLGMWCWRIPSNRFKSSWMVLYGFMDPNDAKLSFLGMILRVSGKFLRQEPELSLDANVDGCKANLPDLYKSCNVCQRLGFQRIVQIRAASMKWAMQQWQWSRTSSKQVTSPYGPICLQYSCRGCIFIIFPIEYNRSLALNISFPSFLHGFLWVSPKIVKNMSTRKPQVPSKPESVRHLVAMCSPSTTEWPFQIWALSIDPRLKKRSVPLWWLIFSQQVLLQAVWHCSLSSLLTSLFLWNLSDAWLHSFLTSAKAGWASHSKAKVSLKAKAKYFCILLLRTLRGVVACGKSSKGGRLPRRLKSGSNWAPLFFHVFLCLSVFPVCFPVSHKAPQRLRQG